MHWQQRKAARSERRRSAAAAGAALAAAALALLVVAAAWIPRAAALGCSSIKDNGVVLGPEEQDAAGLDSAPISIGPGATCWQPDCSAPFPNKRCKTIGRRSLECPALLDAGVAHATRAECCRAAFGDSGCGKYCYVRDTSVAPPNRQCRKVDDLIECDRQYDGGGAHPTYADCCQALFGDTGCGSFPDKCYVPDHANEGRCTELAQATTCADALDARRAWRDRAACCKANGFTSPACREQAVCWVADTSRQPNRACVQVSADDCPQRRAAGTAWDTQQDCCAAAFGPGLGCREFPATCYALVTEPNTRPGEACAPASGAAACAAGLDARPPLAFVSKADCCAAAMPDFPLNTAALEVSEGCVYAPGTCWMAPDRPEPGAFECVEVRDSSRCGRAVAAGANVWPTQAACCRGLYGKAGCRRFPDTCWVAGSQPTKSSPDRDCRRLAGAAACAEAAGNGTRLFTSHPECCEATFGERGCRTYPDRCFARRLSRVNPDRACVAVAGKAACAKELDRRTGAATREACCRGFKGGCVTHPTSCYAPVPLEESSPARTCRMLDEPVKCKWGVAKGESYATLAGCCKAHNCTLPMRCWVGAPEAGGCTFVANDASRCRDGALKGQAFASRAACECALFKRGCNPAACWVKDTASGDSSVQPGNCRQETDAPTCATAVALQVAAAIREECCIQHFDFGSSTCGAGCWVNPNTVALPPPPRGVHRPPLPRQCIQVTSDSSFCAQHWANGVAWLSQHECCNASYPGQGCRVYPDSCWVQVKDKSSPNRRCSFESLGSPKCGARIVSGTAWESEAECCAGAYGAQGCKTFPTTCYGVETVQQKMPARVCRAVTDPAMCPWGVSRGSKHETLAACCAAHNCTLGSSRCWAAGPGGNACSFVAEDEPRCHNLALKGQAFASRAACECALFKHGCAPASCWLREGQTGSATGDEPASCRLESDAAVCTKALELQAAAATQEECCIQHSDFGQSSCGTGCWVNPSKTPLPVMVAGPLRERQCIQVTTDPGFCAKHWAAGAAWLSQQQCCNASYPGQGCRAYPHRCWVPSAEDNSGEALPGTCILKLLGATDCGNRVDTGTAWDSEAACCSRAYGAKGCRPQPEACWMPSPNDAVRACILYVNSSLCLPSVAAGSAFLNETACCTAHRCGPAGQLTLDGFLSSILPLPHFGLPEALHHDKAALTSSGRVAVAPSSAWSPNPWLRAAGLPPEADDDTAPLGACWVRDPTVRGTSPDRRCALQALSAGGCQARLANQTAWVSKAACCGASFGPRGCRAYPDSCWIPGPKSPSRVCRQRKNAPRVCPQAVANGKAFETEAACCHAHRCTKLSSGPCWVPLPAPVPWVPLAAEQRCVLTRDAQRCRAPGGRGAATATKAQCMCVNFREGCDEAQY